MFNKTGKWKFVLLISFLPAILAFSGCATVGPDYSPPEKKIPESWHSETMGGVIQHAPAPEMLAKWWSTLDDPLLTDLMEKAVANNKDVNQAQARIREERARRNMSKAGLFPTLDASGSFRKSKSGRETGSGKETDLYSADFDAGWELDIFGGARRSLEAATAEVQAGEEDFRDILVSLLAEIALNYTDVRIFQARMDSVEKNLAIQDQSYQMAQALYASGLSKETAVEQAKYGLENTRSQIPGLRISLEEAKNRIAVLIGENPGSVHEILKMKRPIPSCPKEIAVGVPADVLRQRPDIRRAERKLAAQTARIGEATAELYPKFTLSGSIGFEAFDPDRLFLSGSRSYSFGPRISWPIFRAGSIRSNVEVQSALEEQLLGKYESAVLNALSEVENQLTVFMEEQNRRQSLNEAKQAAMRAVDLAQGQYQAGMIDFTGVLDAQRSLLSFEDNLIQCEGDIISGAVRLYKALGGGWTSLADGDTGDGPEKREYENHE
ncbi:MAG: efflux transporter outer membrane subunit [Desulfobacula sp.]|jgi:NodT family efflux transporter outer membrane factor (OMF) lipoprotein